MASIRVLLCNHIRSELFPTVVFFQTLKTGKYQDIAEPLPHHYINMESPSNITLDRQTLYCVPIPGENDWVKQISFAVSLSMIFIIDHFHNWCICVEEVFKLNENEATGDDERVVDFHWGELCTKVKPGSLDLGGEGYSAFILV